MPPLVSILIPAYNAQAWIGETIRSALGQTWPEKEIIVVDDGSKDQTLSVARQFESKSVKVVTQPNQGAATARNKAFSLCQGEYIQWLDADDLLGRDKVASQVRRLADCSKRTLLSGPWGKFYYRTQKAKFSPSPLWHDLPPAEWLTRKLGQNCHMQTATWLVSRELTETAGSWNAKLLGDDDGEYFCRVKLGCDGIKFIPDAKVFYRVTNSSRLSYIGRSDRKMEAQFVSMKLHIGYLRSMEDSPRTREACVKYLQQYLYFFYPSRPDIVEESRQIAAALGGQLTTPRASWKYRLIQGVFGWNAAKETQFVYNRWKSTLLGAWDKALLRFDPKNAPRSF